MSAWCEDDKHCYVWRNGVNVQPCIGCAHCSRQVASWPRQDGDGNRMHESQANHERMCRR